MQTVLEINMDLILRRKKLEGRILERDLNA